MSSTDTTIIAPIAPIAIEPDPAERGVLQKRVDDETLKPLERIDCGLLLIEKFGCSARTERVVRRLVKELRNYSHASLIVQNRVRNKASALRDVMVAQLALRPAKPVEEEPVAPTTSVTPSATGFDKLVGNVSLLSDTGDFAAKLRMYSGVEPRGNTPEDLIQAIGGEALLEHLLKHPSLISQDKTVIDTAYREVVASLVPLLDEKSEAGLRKLWAAQTQPFVELVKNSKDELDVALTASGRTLQAVLFACDWPGKRLSFVDMVQDVPSCDIDFQLMYGSPKPERLAPGDSDEGDRCSELIVIAIPGSM